MRRRLSHLWVLAVGVVLVAPAAARAQRPQAPTTAAAPAADSKSEESLDQKAKRLFAAGRYSDAIEILAQLYAQTNNPIYLRNIGRCYQRLPDPERAIASFEEYLLRGKNISRSEREEVRGFIRELQDQKRRNSETAAAPVTQPKNSQPKNNQPAPAPQQPAVIDPAPAPVQPVAPAIASPAPGPLATEPAAMTPPLFAPTAFGPPPDSAAAPTGRPLARTLAVAAMGVAGALAVSGGVVMATAWSRYNSAEKTCLLKANCGEAARTVDSRNRLAKLLLIGAAVTGVAGVTVYLIDPGRRGESGLALAVGGRF